MPDTGPCTVPCAYPTPRISYSDLKTVIWACPSGHQRVASAVYGELQGGGCTRGGAGWVVPGGVYRVVPSRASYWYCQGPTIAIYRLSASTQALQARVLAFRTPGLLALRYAS